MLIVPLSSVPNQRITFNVDGAYWELYVYAAIEHMCCDITRNGELLINAVRCFGGIPLMPYDYIQGEFGNFIFNADADWELFGGQVQLYYLTNSEMSEYNAQLVEGLYKWQPAQ